MEVDLAAQETDRMGCMIEVIPHFRIIRLKRGLKSGCLIFCSRVTYGLGLRWCE